MSNNQMASLQPNFGFTFSNKYNKRTRMKIQTALISQNIISTENSSE